MILKSSFFKRVYLSYVVVIAVTAIVIGVLVSHEVVKNTLKETDQLLKSQANIIVALAKNKFSQGEYAALNDSIQQVAAKIETRITIIDKAGIVVVDTQQSVEKMDNHGSRPEVLQAKSNSYGVASRNSQTLNKEMRYLALSVTDKGEIIGYVRLSLPLTNIDQLTHNLQLAVLIGALIAGLAGLLVGLFFARKFSMPLLSMSEGAMAIAKGDYHKRIWLEGNDEVSKLAGSFNFMAEESAKKVAQLTEDNNKLATILSGMVEGVIAIDQEQKIIHINEVAASLLNVSANASIGMSVKDVIRIEEVNKILQKVLVKQNVVRENVKVTSTDSDLVLEVYCASIRDDSESKGAILVLHDMSELYRLERVRQDFVANASHELKTPITVIRGVVETILDDDEMPRDVLYKFLNKAYLQTERLSNIVSDLMTISRLESGVEAQAEILELQPLLTKTLQSFYSIAQEKQINLNFEFIHNPKVIGDRQALSQVFDNLLDNAIKYTQKGGDIKMLLQVSNNNVIIEIADTGIGICKDDLSRVFERFYRVDKGRSRALGSTGLGLAIVKHIVEQHGGNITVTSKQGEGSVFKVSLPKA